MNEIGGEGWKKIKHIKMNYKVDEPTETGRIYKKYELKKVFDKALKQRLTVPIVRNSVELYTEEGDKNPIYKPIVRIKDIIGIFKGYEIKDNGEIIIDVKPVINTDLFDLFLIGTGIVGLIRKDNTVNIYSLSGFFLAGSMYIVEPKII